MANNRRGVFASNASIRNALCVFYTSGVRVCYWYDLSSTINKRHPNEIVRIDFNRSHKKKNGGDVKWMANDKRRNVNWCAHTYVCTRNFNSVNLIEWLEMCFLVRHPFFVHCIRQTRGKSKLHWNYTEQWAHNSYRINAGDEFVLCLTSEKWRQQTDIINRLYRIQWAIRKLFFFLLFIWFVWSKHQLGFFVRK